MNDILKPEILTHPNIPKPLHGLSPRTIMGRDWWDTTRQEVYKKYDYHCIACGVHKSSAKVHQWLEAHEYFDVNYNTGICTIRSIEPLCHSCHNFIHSGRLSMIVGKEKSVEEVIAILEHGFSILAANKLKCFPFTLEFAESLCCNTFNVKPYEIKENEKLKWSSYKLVFAGKTYNSKFKDEEEWMNNYQ